MKERFSWSASRERAFNEICSARWGIHYGEENAYVLRDLVERAYTVSGTRSVAEFAEQLAGAPDSDPEIQAFVGQMVVGETSFFRNAPQFDALLSTILPQLVAARRRDGTKRLRMWSAGCASGEEPYSLAICVDRVLPEWREWDVEIVATDVNPYALRRAREAVYSEWSFRGVDREIVDHYFVKLTRLRRLDHPCRRIVRFERHNLAKDATPNPRLGIEDLDIVLCRNVTIYFARELTIRLAASFHEALRRGGWLLVGHTEPDFDIYRRFEAVDFPDTIAYRRPRRGSKGSGELRTSERPERRTPERPREKVVEPAYTFADALAAYDDADRAAAFELLVAVAVRDASDPRAPHLLAQVSADEKRYDESLYWSFTALQRDPFHVPTLMLMGLVYLETGSTMRAREQFHQAIFLAPERAEAHLYLALAHAALGNDELAARSRARAASFARATDGAPEPLLPVERARRFARDLPADP